MKKGVLTLALLALAFTATVFAQPYYLRGEVSPCDWGNSSAGCELTDADSDGIYELTLDLGATGIGRKEFKIYNAGTDSWYPGGSNAWYIHGGGTVTFRIHASDNLIEAVDGGSWGLCAPGAFSGWNNAASMTQVGNTWYYTIADPGSYEWKPTVCGAWDSWQSWNGERSVNSNNWSVTTTTANEQVCVTYDPATGRTGPVLWYADLDGDGYGDASAASSTCAQPSGYVANDDDCNDASASVHPGASETCNNTDDDCDGQIDEGTAIAPITFTATAPACNGGTGSLRVNPPAPVVGYTYIWNNGSTARTITGIPAGVYTVTVTKTATGCTGVATGTLSQPAVIAITTTVVAPKCFGGTDGKVTAAATGGTGAKTYLWNTGSTATSVTGAAGTYTVTVTDTKGCTKSASATIVNPAQLVVTVTYTPSATAGKYKATVVATGGTPYTTGGPYRYCKVSPTGACAFTATAVYDNLLANTAYTFRARDKNLCVASVTATTPAFAPSAGDRDEISEVGFQVAPNPFDQQLTVRSTESGVQTRRVQLFDLTGRMVIEQEWAAGSTALQINTAALMSGVYFVKVSDASGAVLTTFKAVKSN